MFFLLKWIFIICATIVISVWAYIQLDKYIDVKKTSVNVAEDIKEGIRKPELVYKP